MKQRTEFTKNDKRFFSKPRTMEEVMNDLFKGDAWEANNFQTVNLLGRKIKQIVIDRKLYLVNYDYKETVSLNL